MRVLAGSLESISLSTIFSGHPAGGSEYVQSVALSDETWIKEALGSDASELGFQETSAGLGAVTIAYIHYRSMVIAAEGSDRDTALASLRGKVSAHLETLRDAPEIVAVEELNLVAEEEGGSQPTRRFVRPMSADRARLELELGIDDALIFLDEDAGTMAVASRGAGGGSLLLRLGDPVQGEDSAPAALPVPGRVSSTPEDGDRHAAKAARVRTLLRCPLCHGELGDTDDGLRCSSCERDFPGHAGKPVLTFDRDHDPSPQGQPESANPYGQQALSLIEAHPDGWVLDCGSGSPERGFSNVVHLELFAFPEVDVVTDGQAIPFAGDTFDAILSEAVLEHVRDPQAYVDEIARVLKPDGLALFDAAFLQPYHGYPDHYFNMTRAGLRLVVEKSGLQVVSLAAGPHQHPMVSLSLMLNGFVSATADPDRKQALLAMTIGDSITSLAAGGGPPFDGLDAEGIDRLAAGFACLVRKPAGDQA